MPNKTSKILFPFFNIAPWRVVFFATVGLLLLFALTPRGYAQSEPVASETKQSSELTFPYKKKFTISSYYTPLPDQSRFFRGTYEADVRLNGEGVHAADGTLVYPGMAAASKAYPFGTKMEIPGFGIVAIHDRGGAIKGDRLDIWVGRGDEGLARALGWGMRTLEVTVYGVDLNIQESVNFESIPLADLSKFLVQTSHFKTDLTEDDSGPEIAELQRFLKKLGFFEDEITGYFGSETHAAVQKFQLEEKVIPNLEDPGAGNFGPKSRMAFEALIEKRKQEALANLPIPQTFDALLKFQMEMGIITKRSDFGAGFYGPKTQKALQEFVVNSWTPGVPFIPSQTERKNYEKELALGDRGPSVSLVQEELQRLHFLGVEPTGYYGKTTEHAVFKFQQATGILALESDVGAGIVGPKTLEKLNELASARTEQKKLIAETTEQKTIVASRIAEERTLLVFSNEIGEFSNELTYGTRGTSVNKLQRTLKRLGFFPGRLTTEYFGDITKQSVSTFQKSHGLPQSGVLDEPTRKLLNQIAQPA
jgi:peptidoglycan hydrolase-like protein with peptidoglycan-binding domain/3D (Asp-Asp-Asp) domain-containing protein